LSLILYSEIEIKKTANRVYPIGWFG